MEVAILSIHGHGKANEERVWLNVLADCDLGFYALADTTYNDNDKISNKLRHFYWFPHKDVKKGDYIILSTGTGKNTSYRDKDGDMIHEFYWRLGNPIWNDDGDIAVLLHTSEWQSTKAK